MTNTNAGFILTGIDQTTLFQMIAQKHAIRLEALGLKHSRGSVTAHVKKAYGLTGSRDEVLAGLEIKINGLKAKIDADRLKEQISTAEYVSEGGLIDD